MKGILVMSNSMVDFSWVTPLNEIKSAFSSISFPNLREIIVGLTFCAVRTTDDIVGLSFTMTDPRRPPIRGKYPLVERSWQELMNFFLSDRPTERSLGLATINALSQTFLREKITTEVVNDGSEWLPNPAGLRIGMVGAIHPLIRQIIAKNGKILLRDATVFQRGHHQLPKEGVTLVPSVEKLKNVDHLLVTGSAIVHKGFEEILTIFPTIRGERVLIGPSAQILPHAAFKDGFTILASSRVEQVERTMQTVREGAGYHLFQKYCRKYVIRYSQIP